ncbi:hypothetical protein APHAL10511_003552 [Amanita phalloides]|nr:hypothetical protein APHAL10511_003552 [Amanita phalloides]
MKFIFAVLLFVAYVAAHGFVHQIIIDGKAYLGNAPAATQGSPSVIRQISTIDPVKGSSNSNLNCGQNAQPAALIADAQPGSTVAVDWRGNDLIHWFHNTGPIMTYMASCGDVTCDKFNPMQAKWFLIDEQGRYPNGTWAQASLNQGAMATVKIPSNLKAGNYMFRQELIALQLGVSVGGAEFYPSCSQLRVGGSQAGQPQQSDLVSLPGAYSDTAPGIYDPNVYDPGSKYTFPGPPLASFIAGGSTGGSSTGGSSTPTSTSAPPASTSSCKLRGGGKNATAYSNTRRALQYHRHLYKPRTISRIMRNVVTSQ